MRQMTHFEKLSFCIGGNLEALQYVKNNTAQKTNFSINPNKAGLFEGSLSWGGSCQSDPPVIFQEERI